jgi:hypothetical protein
MSHVPSFILGKICYVRSSVIPGTIEVIYKAFCRSRDSCNLRSIKSFATVHQNKYEPSINSLITFYEVIGEIYMGSQEKRRGSTDHPIRGRAPAHGRRRHCTPHTRARRDDRRLQARCVPGRLLRCHAALSCCVDPLLRKVGWSRRSLRTSAASLTPADEATRSHAEAHSG